MRGHAVRWQKYSRGRLAVVHASVYMGSSLTPFNTHPSYLWQHSRQLQALVVQNNNYLVESQAQYIRNLHTAWCHWLTLYSVPGALAGRTVLLRVTQVSGARILWRILLSISWHEGWDNLKTWTGIPTHLFSCGFDFRLGCLGEVRLLT